MFINMIKNTTNAHTQKSERKGEFACYEQNLLLSQFLLILVVLSCEKSHSLIVITPARDNYFLYTFCQILKLIFQPGTKF